MGTARIMKKNRQKQARTERELAEMTNSIAASLLNRLPQTENNVLQMAQLSAACILLDQAATGAQKGDPKAVTEAARLVNVIQNRVAAVIRTLVARCTECDTELPGIAESASGIGRQCAGCVKRLAH